jgi:hypothetical protein
MAFEKVSGRYQMNPQRAAHADKMAAKGGLGSKPMSPPMNKMEKGNERPMMDEPKGEMSSTWNQHADGSHETESSDGESMPHGSAKEALAHMAEKHGHQGLADHIMMHDDSESDHDGDEMPMPEHGHMLAGL